MSLLAHHGLMSGRLVPHAWNTVNAAAATGSTYTIALITAPTPGRLLIISAGGNGARTVVTPPTGFTNIASIGSQATVTNVFYWRIADGTEPANWTIVWNSALTGGWDVMEISNFDEDTPFGFHHGNQNVGSSVTPAAAGYVVPWPGLVFATLSKTSTSGWAPNNGFFDLSGANEHSRGYKLYGAADPSETMSFTGSGSTATSEIYFINGKRI